MKLSKFDTKTKAEKGVEIELKDIATGEGSGIFFTILGTDSDAFRDAELERSRDMLAMSKKRGKDYKPSREEIDDGVCKILAACTVGWRGLEDDDGEPIPFSTKAAEELYQKYPRIRDQINVAMADPANFLMG